MGQKQAFYQLNQKVVPVRELQAVYLREEVSECEAFSTP
jgi:DNA-dependent RNA polymerase auxiliary subunit epsilon